MLNLVIFGAPGSGKGTQSELLEKEYGLLHISTGEVLRNHIAAGTKLGIIADSYISKGQLIPDELMVKILSDLLAKDERSRKGVIFDGFPRTIDQAKSLKKMLESHGAMVHAVIGLEVKDEELIERLLKRGIDSGRADDNLETIKQRLHVYHSQTQPLEDYYKSEGKYHSIVGSGSIEEIFSSIKESLFKAGISRESTTA